MCAERDVDIRLGCKCRLTTHLAHIATGWGDDWQYLDNKITKYHSSLEHLSPLPLAVPASLHVTEASFFTYSE